MKSIWKASAVAAVVMLAAACGDDDDSAADDPARQDLVDAMVSEGASEDEANCFIDELGLDDAERIYGADEADLSEDDMDKTLSAFEECSSSDDESDDNDDDASSDDDSGDDESASGDLSAMKDCAESAGLTVANSTAPDDLNESLGIVDSFTVVSSQGGAGSVTLYTDGDLATEAREVESDLESDGVTIGQMNELVYTYSGDSDGLASLEGCL